MAIEFIITVIALGILIVVIIHQRKVQKKLQLEIDKKKQQIKTESKENHFQKPQNKLGKNKWLYTTDNFGKMEKGRVD